MTPGLCMFPYPKTMNATVNTILNFFARIKMIGRMSFLKHFVENNARIFQPVDLIT